MLHRIPQPAGHGGAAARCFRSAPPLPTGAGRRAAPGGGSAAPPRGLVPLWAPFGRPPCGTRKELRAARLLVLSDHYGCSVSLYPPPAALDSAPLRSPPHFPIFRITPPARAYPCPPARTRAIRNFPRKFLLLFRRKFSFFGPPNLHPVH